MSASESPPPAPARGAASRAQNPLPSSLPSVVGLLLLALLAGAHMCPCAVGGTPASISAHIIPLECNEDGTYYPGDSFAVNYSVIVPPGGMNYDRWGHPCQYYYSFDYVEVVGDYVEVEGGESHSHSMNQNGTIGCRVSEGAPPGTLRVEIVAHLTRNYQYWVNETYPIYENGTIVGYGWQWVSCWGAEPLEESAVMEIEVVRYDPHFTMALYPITKGDAAETYRMDLALLVRYDGNGPSHSLRQRAVVDAYSSSALGTAIFLITSPDDLPPLVMKGFYGLRPATAEDFTAQGALPDAMKPLLNSLLNATYNGSLGTVYIGYRNCQEYGPLAAPGNFTRTVFTSSERYARYVFSPSAAQTLEDLGIGNLDVNATMKWSRFPTVERTASAGLPYLKVRVPLTVKAVAVEPNGTLVPAAAGINFTVASLSENDLLFSSLFEPPVPMEEDEWFAQQWAADTPAPANATAAGILAEYSGEGTVTGLVPRTASCCYNLTVLAARGGTTTCGWVPIFISFDEEEREAVVNVNVNVNPDPTTSVAYFRDHLSWVEMRIATGASTLRSAVIFSVNASGSGEGGVAGANGSTGAYVSAGAGEGEGESERGSGRIVWRTVSWSPQYGGGAGASYDLWAEKPKTLDHDAAVYVEVTDMWGNTQVLDAGTASPYAEGIGDIPYSGIFVVIFMVVGAMVLYEVLQKIASRL